MTFCLYADFIPVSFVLMLFACFFLFVFFFLKKCLTCFDVVCLLLFAWIAFPPLVSVLMLLVRVAFQDCFSPSYVVWYCIIVFYVLKCFPRCFFVIWVFFCFFLFFVFLCWRVFPCLICFIAVCLFMILKVVSPVLRVLMLFVLVWFVICVFPFKVFWCCCSFVLMLNCVCLVCVLWCGLLVCVVVPCFFIVLRVLMLFAFVFVVFSHLLRVLMLLFLLLLNCSVQLFFPRVDVVGPFPFNFGLFSPPFYVFWCCLFVCVFFKNWFFLVLRVLMLLVVAILLSCFTPFYLFWCFLFLLLNCCSPFYVF